MKALIAVFWLSFLGVAFAQSIPPLQTINTNQGIACNAIGSQGAVSFCKPGWTYGCNSTQVANQLLGTDGNRTSIQFQNTSAVPETLVFGDSANSQGTNGWVVQPGNAYLWSNMNQGNTPGRVASSTVSVISTTGAGSCVFMFTE
jgi:hypothetical protein